MRDLGVDSALFVLCWQLGLHTGRHTHMSATHYLRRTGLCECVQCMTFVMSDEI